eukprot:gnl/MRDRNA2_/MRDRNA2_135143_c0_seq1.p1 gnl/MRDRNA2_/MRDRNA2_135143_c0~~gnl/MRDRNA2_/MRDRNA2_135143_c0_seq1.p1  ORF type:complete len:312 (+),score=32.91 gnl/MRDRNA2_/MRDRNA2_135143_c0_seq1:78-1013(+)
MGKSGRNKMPETCSAADDRSRQNGRTESSTQSQVRAHFLTNHCHVQFLRPFIHNHSCSQICRNAAPWVGLKFTIFTPFIEVSGVLEVHPPPRGFRDIAEVVPLSPGLLKQLERISDHTGRGEIGEIIWRMDFKEWTEYPGINASKQSKNKISSPCLSHVWHRLKMVPAVIGLHATCFSGSYPVIAVLTQGMEYPIYLADEVIQNLHITIRLFSETEAAVDGMMELHKALHDDHDDCCICMMPITKDQTVRRLPCTHVLHAACAMDPASIPSTKTCPLCRQSLTHPVEGNSPISLPVLRSSNFDDLYRFAYQ